MTKEKWNEYYKVLNDILDWDLSWLDTEWNPDNDDLTFDLDKLLEDKGYNPADYDEMYNFIHWYTEPEYYEWIDYLDKIMEEATFYRDFKRIMKVHDNSKSWWNKFDGKPKHKKYFDDAIEDYFSPEFTDYKDFYNKNKKELEYDIVLWVDPWRFGYSRKNKWIVCLNDHMVCIEVEEENFEHAVNCLCRLNHSYEFINCSYDTLVHEMVETL